MKLNAYDRFLVFFLLLYLTVAEISVTLYIPALPHIANDLSQSIDDIQFTVIIYFMAFGLVQLCIGPLSDAKGRRFVMLLGQAIFILGTCVVLYHPTIKSLILSRFLQGLGAGAIPVLERAVVRDRYDGKKLYFIASILLMSASIVPAFSPFLGGLILHRFDWIGIYYALLIHSIFVTVLLYFYFPETISQKALYRLSIKESLRRYFKLLIDKKFVAFTLLTTGTYSAQIYFLSVTPFVFQDRFGMTPIAFGALMLIPAGFYMTGGFLSSQAAKKLPWQVTLYIGIVILGSGGIGMWLAKIFLMPTIASTILFISISMMGHAMIFANSLVTAISPYKNQAGLTSAFLGAMYLLCSSFLVDTLNHFAHHTLLYMASVFIGLSLFCAAVFTYILYVMRKA